MNMIPAVCSACNYTFDSGISLGGSKLSVVTSCSSACPRCGKYAPVMDSYTDVNGELHIGGMFKHLQNIKDHKKLEKLQAHIEAENDSITALELSNALTELDPSFSKFSKLITSIPPSAIKDFINTLITIIALIVAFQTLNSADENHDESIELQKEQLKLSREEFEYNKQQNMMKELIEKQEIENQINQLRLEFEKKLRETQATQLKIKKSTSRKSLQVKGNQRNKPCPCGSGIKSKKCHPQGFQENEM